MFTTQAHNTGARTPHELLPGQSESGNSPGMTWDSDVPGQWARETDGK